MNIARSYQNCCFSVLGDSVSTLDGYQVQDYAVFYDFANMRRSGVLTLPDTWWGQLIDALGGTLLVNGSYSGSLVCRHPQCEIESYGCSDARTAALGTAERSPDVILILMGFNDFGNHMPVEPSPQSADFSVFSVAYAAMLQKLKQNYPEAELWCLTLPVSDRLSRAPAAALRLPGEHSLEAYCRAICTCARQYGCRVLDIFDPASPFETMDGNHPTAAGMRTIAAAVWQCLEGEGCV